MPIATLDYAVSDQYTFDPKTGRYRWKAGTASAGQFAPRLAVLELTRANIDYQKQELLKIVSQLSDGKISLRQFQQQAAMSLRRIHIQNAVLGRGGLDRMTAENWLQVGRTLKVQFYDGKGEDGRRFGLKHLAAEIKTGTVSPAQLQYRLGLYAESGKVTYWQQFINSERQDGRGYGRRVLGDAEHCPDCVAYAAMGRQKLEDIVLPGTRCQCLSNCRCSIKSFR